MKPNALNKMARQVTRSDCLVLIAAAILTLTACSATSPPPAAEEKSTTIFQKGVPGGIIINTVEVSGSVTAIDKANRKFTLLGADGEKITLTVGLENFDFEQIRVGDRVKTTATEETIIYLEGEGGPFGEGEAGVVALTPKDAKPNSVVVQTREIIATVVTIDWTERTATLRFDDGSTKTFPVRGDVDLSRHEVGERVVFRVTDMIAISVEKP